MAGVRAGKGRRQCCVGKIFGNEKNDLFFAVQSFCLLFTVHKTVFPI